MTDVARCRLGLRLGPRHVGFATVYQDRPVRYGVLNLDKLKTPEAREARFQQRLLRELTRFHYEAVCVARSEHSVWHPEVVRQLAHVERAVGATPLMTISVDRLKRDLGCSSVRKLVCRLQALYPELQSVVEVPTNPGISCSKTQYWSHMFVALAAAFPNPTLYDQDRSPP